MPRNPLKLNRKFALVSFAVIVISVFLIVGVFRRLYKISKGKYLTKVAEYHYAGGQSGKFLLKNAA